MSHTDKTDPFWVRMRTGYYPAEPVHDHRSGPCDLKPLEEWNRIDGWWFSRGRCYWSWVYDGRGVCGCGMCHGFPYGPYGSYFARRDRHDTKAQTKKWVADFNTHGDIEEWWA